MGLDMYAVSTKREAINLTSDEYEDEEILEVFYWRKHPNLHGWMQRLYQEKGGEDKEFNVCPVELTAEDLDRLEEDIRNDNLVPTEGFFFGTSRDDEEQKEVDLDFIRLGRQSLSDGYHLWYYAWY